MQDSETKPGILPQRLCSEIQLFDLCDLSSCRHKNGRYCTEPDLLSSFEKIAEEELRAPERFISDESDDEAGDDFGVGYEDEDDEFAQEDCEEGWEDQE